MLAYVTPVTVEGQTVAILHYEHGLEEFQLALNKGLEGENQFVVAVNDAGRVVSDSKITIDIDQQGDNESPEHYFEEFNFNGRNLSEVLEVTTESMDRLSDVHELSGLNRAQVLDR